MKSIPDPHCNINGLEPLTLYSIKEKPMARFGLSLKFTLLLFLVVFYSCSRNAKVNKAVLDVEIDNVNIKRYELALFNIDTLQLQEELKLLQLDYPLFLNADLSDPSNIARIQNFISDTMVRNIYNATLNRYPDLGFLEKDLTLAFKHIKFYFPDWEPPDVYTYVSGLMYEVPVSYNGFELVIALDMYLGEEFELYRKIGMPLYKIQRMNKEKIIADCIEEIIRSGFISALPPGNMLDKMIQEGKVYYMLDRMLPLVTEEQKIGFTENQLRWCRQNESNMWAYFIENELLFTSDPIIINRFINDGPFTTAFGNDSPARASVWVGWQIVKAYMDKNKSLSPSDLVTKQNAREILNSSGYKPRRFGF